MKNNIFLKKGVENLYHIPCIIYELFFKELSKNHPRNVLSLEETAEDYAELSEHYGKSWTAFAWKQIKHCIDYYREKQFDAEQRW